MTHTEYRTFADAFTGQRSGQKPSAHLQSEHAVHFAAALPGTRWQPTDFEAENLLSIAARCDAQHLHNVHAPLQLDVQTTSWPVPDDFDTSGWKRVTPD